MKLFGNQSISRASYQANIICSPEDFRTLVERERMRADRSRLPLSMIALELADSEATRDNLRQLVAVLQRRLRATDSTGIVGHRRVGVLLPDTPIRSALKLSGDLRELLEASQLGPQVRVFAYGLQDGIDDDFRGTGLDEFTPDLPIHDLQSWLAEPLPPWKRTVDIFGAALGLMLVSPLMGIVAIAIKVSSSGPVVFSQQRSGLGGRPFTMYKFRSMIPDAEVHKASLMTMNEQDGPAFKIERDPRVTRLGSVLRKSSLDELPQLWNVLKGDMSLVGPRPLPCEETRNCEGWHRRRLNVTPGITCHWQVNGRSRESFADWARADIAYTARRTVWKDLKILWKTIPAVITCRGAG